MREKIKELIEQRIIEATKKQVSSKLNNIARSLGNPIIASTAFNNYLPDAWALPDEDVIYDPTVIHDAEEWEEENRGFHFDGLKFGVNLVITSLMYGKQVVELKATYNGYLVYAEIEGDLRAYAPFAVWEENMEMFYEGAIAKEKSRMQAEKEQAKEDLKKRFSNFWKSFRMLWGY